MPCPFFLPGPDDGSRNDGVTSGCCAAQPAKPLAATFIRDACFAGYARAFCPQAAVSDMDAARFLIRKDTLVSWALEREHHPVAVGVTEGTQPRTGYADLDVQLKAWFEYRRAERARNAG
jgi:hypothetical protein